MRKNITWTYTEAFCMLERSNGAKGGAGVAGGGGGGGSNKINLHQTSFPTVVNALKMS